MGSHRPQGIFAWFKAKLFVKTPQISEFSQARSLIAAVDRGGIPLNAAKVNAIARNLGLEVSRKAPVEQTLQRIRLALSREASHE